MTDSESLEKSAVAEIPVDSLSDIYNDKAENLAYRKLDFIILPLLFLGFFGLQLDRGNIANALTDTILKDLDITQDTINTGTQVLSAGIIIFEIPSNVLLQRVGAQKWITGQIIAWGLVATFQSFVKSRSTFLATRFLLGACEAGFIPGTLYYLSRWYRKSQYATPKYNIFSWKSIWHCLLGGYWFWYFNFSRQTRDCRMEMVVFDKWSNDHLHWHIVALLLAGISKNARHCCSPT